MKKPRKAATVKGHSTDTMANRLMKESQSKAPKAQLKTSQKYKPR